MEKTSGGGDDDVAMATVVGGVLRALVANGSEENGGLEEVVGIGIIDEGAVHGVDHDVVTAACVIPIGIGLDDMIHEGDNIELIHPTALLKFPIIFGPALGEPAGAEEGDVEEVGGGRIFGEVEMAKPRGRVCEGFVEKELRLVVGGGANGVLDLLRDLQFGRDVVHVDAGATDGVLELGWPHERVIADWG